MAYTHIDCFSGPGGICTGMHAAGFDTKIAIEFIQSCCDTYAANHPEVHLIHSDIRDVKAEDIIPYIPKGGVDLVTSGMPCETFSTAGNKSRSFYDDRQFLFREGIRIAQISNAKMILFENVPGIKTKTVEKGSKILIVDVLKKELEEAGYINYKEFVLNADDFGVPQRRKRYFILACKNFNWELIEPTPDEGKTVTVEQALASLPNVIPNSNQEAFEYEGKDSSFSKKMKDLTFWKRKEFNNNLTYQMPMRHREPTLERFGLLKQGESLKNLFERYEGEERKKLQEKRILPKKCLLKEIIVLY